MSQFAGLLRKLAHVNRAVWAPVAIALFGLVILATSSDPAPINPPQFLFSTPNVQGAISAAQSTPETSDFADRPLLRSDRRPPSLEQQPQPVETEEEPPQPMESIEGAMLVGIFGSGDVKGVLVRLEDGERKRLVVGDTLKGWILDWVGPRRAVFVASRGAGQAQLDMAFADVKPLPNSEPRVRQRANSDAARDRQPEGESAGASEAEAALVTDEPGAPPGSFGSAYRERRRRSQEPDQQDKSE